MYFILLLDTDILDIIRVSIKTYLSSILSYLNALME